MFCNFRRISEESAFLKSKFLKAMSRLSIENKISKENVKLDEILTKSNHMDIKIHEMLEHSGVFMVFITCHLDRILIDLAEKYDFPRGFPILWIPDKVIKFFGFYPKFKNDERQSPEDIEQFKEIESIQISLKISGFLGLLIAFELDGEIFWTATSKNSCSDDSSFVKDAADIFGPYVTPELLQEMCLGNITICAEILSQNDQKHGYVVRRNLPVITAISSGTVIDIRPIEQAEAAVSVIERIPRFLTFMSPPEMFSFCDRFNLPHFSSYSTMTQETSMRFMVSLGERRDMMDFTLFSELMSLFDTIVEGNINYFECIGEILEGLVMHITRKDGSTVTKKYKFPRYTIRTFVLRDIETGKSSIDYFLDNWVVSSDGKQYWRAMFFGYLITGISYFHEPSNLVAKHIMIADMTTHQSDYEQSWNLLCTDSIMSKEASTIKRLSRGAIHDLILFLGPFSFGKSTYANLLENLSGPRFRHIDGDTLNLDNSTVSAIGAQRNELSLSVIIESLMRGEVPIISCGGGILTSGFGSKKKTFYLREYVRKTLSIEIDITTVLVSKTLTEAEINPCDPDAVFEALRVYTESDSLVERNINGRVERREWTVKPGDMPTILKKSRDNKEIARLIISESDYLFVVPIYNYPETPRIPLLVNHCRNYQSSLVQIGKFTQKRLLSRVYENGEFLCTGHFTLKYNGKGFQGYSIPPIQRRVIRALFFEITSDDGKNYCKIALPDEDYPEREQYSHITVINASHENAEMKNIAQALFDKRHSINIPKKGGKETIIYDLTKGVFTPTTIEFLSIFHI